MKTVWRHYRLVGLGLWKTSGQAALQLALPLYLGLFLIAAIVFGGNGLSPRTVVESANESLGVRVALYAAWFAISTAPIRTLVAAPASFLLRSLPLRHAELLLQQLLFVLVLELPWLLLWGAGGGLFMGFGATLLSLSLSCLWQPWHGRKWPLWVCAGALGSMLMDGGSAGHFVLSSVTAGIAVLASFRFAPEAPTGESQRGLWGAGIWVLFTATLVLLRRRAAPQLLRGAGLILLATLSAWLVLMRQTEPSRDVVWWAVLSLVPPLVLSIFSLCGVLLQLEREQGWLYAVCGTSHLVRHGTQCGVVLAWGVSAALCHGLLLSALLALPPEHAAAASCQCVGVACIVTTGSYWVSRWAILGKGRDALRLLVGSMLSMTVVMFGYNNWRGWALCWGGMAAGLACAYLLNRSRKRSLFLSSELRRWQ